MDEEKQGENVTEQDNGMEQQVLKGFEKAGEEAGKQVAKIGKKIAKEAGKLIVKIGAKILAAIAPYLPVIIGVIVIIMIAIFAFGVISQVADSIKEAFSNFTSNIVGIFTFDDSTNTYEVTNDELDKIIEELEKDKDIDLEKDYDLTKDDMKSFLEADLVTQTIEGYKVGDTNGAIKIYMTDPNTETENAIGSPLTFESYDSFMSKVNNKDDSCLSEYTVDSSNNIIVAAKNESRTYEDGSLVSETYTYTTKSFGYKTVTAQYEMPLMFFIDLCMTTSNKDYTLAVADQVKDTEIIITMQDVRTETNYTHDEERTTGSGNEQTTEIVTIEEINITNSLTPVVTKADTLLYTKEMIYTNKIETRSSGDTTTVSNTFAPGIEKATHIKVQEFGDTAKSKEYPKGEAYNSLISGGDILFDIMERDVNNETIEQTLKYILYKLSGHNFGVTQLDESLFEFGGFQNITSATGEFSLTESMFTKEVFVEAMRAYGNKTSNQGYKTNFLPRAELIYDLGVKYNINPELILTMARKESSFTTKNGNQNYFGWGTPNGKSLLYIADFEEAIAKLASTVHEYYDPTNWKYNAIIKEANVRSAANCNPNGYGQPGTLRGFLMLYSDLIGNYNNGYHTYGNWGNGGTIYLEKIYGSEFDAKCGYHSNGRVGAGGHTSNTKFTIQERADYTAYLFDNQIDFWNDIFADYGTLSSGGTGVGSYDASSTGTGYTGVYTSSAGLQYKAYKQYIYADVYGESTTRASWLKSSGCGLCSAAIIISAYNDNVTPVTLYDNYREVDGNVNISKYLNASNVKHNVEYSYDKQKLISWLVDGNSAIVSLMPNATINGESWAGSSGHYITFLDINSSNQVYVSNPGANDGHKNGNINIDSFDGKITKVYYIQANGAKKVSVGGNVSQILNYNAAQGWQLVTENRFSSKPSISQYPQSLANSLMTTIEVKVRVWKNSGEKSSTDLEKVDSTKKLTVNKHLADLWKAFFNDIYNQCPDFVVDKSSTSVYVYKASGSRLSAHAFGAALDLNWNTTGNGYKSWGARGPYTEQEWKALPETRTKYETIYINGPIHKLAQKYTLEWGGTWNTYDGMHFSYVGDMSDRCRK